MAAKKNTDEPWLATAAELIPFMDISRRRFHQLIEEGVIPGAVKRGRYDAEASIAGYIRYLQGLAQGKGDNAHRDAQTQLAIERAKKAQRENEVAAGELIPKADMVEAMQTAFAHCRARMLSIPTKLAPVVILCESVTDAKEKLTEAVYDACNEIAETRGVAISENEPKRRRRARGN